MGNEIWKDPIVAEIHAVREEIARRFNGDLEAIVADIRKRQEANPGRVVRKGEVARRGARGRQLVREGKDAA